VYFKLNIFYFYLNNFIIWNILEAVRTFIVYRRPKSLFESSFLLSPSLFYLLVHSRCRGCLFSLDNTQTHTTVGRTPLDEGSAPRRDLYLTTQTLYKRKIHASGGIRTHDPSKRSAADLRLRPRGHWVWVTLSTINISVTVCSQKQHIA
jgi:hypothetical protein